MPAVDNFPDAHNAGKKKNVWKKTVGSEKKSAFASYKDKAATFVRRQYNNYMKDMSIEKIIATQIAAVGKGSFAEINALLKLFHI